MIDHRGPSNFAVIAVFEKNSEAIDAQHRISQLLRMPAAPPAANLVSFDSLPIGARFRYEVVCGHVWVKIGRGEDQLGTIAEWSQPQLDWVGQGVYSFADSPKAREEGMVEWLDMPPPAALSSKNRSHPEDFCERCKGPNVIWFAPSPLWNAAHGEWDILCPVCFVTLAVAAGINQDAWRIAPEFYVETPADPPLWKCPFCSHWNDPDDRECDFCPDGRQPEKTSPAHIANEWADMATNGIQWLRNVRDGISTPETALKEMESNLLRIQALQAGQVTTPPPAPVSCIWRDGCRLPAGQCAQKGHCDGRGTAVRG